MITCVFTSCGRFDLLDITIKSFINHNTLPIEKYIVIDNSTKIDAMYHIEKIVSNLKNVDVIINSENIGQVASIDKAYSLITTEYIFHCEDDWYFYRSGFMEKSLEILLDNSMVVNVNIRERNNGDRGSFHPIDNNELVTKYGVKYFLYSQNYLGEWHGFSWNPGLRRKSDYNIIAPYKQYVNEQGVGSKYKELGFRSACLDMSYCKHIYWHIFTFLS